jgi:hypothetical protein
VVNVFYARQNGRVASQTFQHGSGPVLTETWSYEPRGLTSSLSNSISVSSVSSCLSLYTDANDCLGRRLASQNP